MIPLILTTKILTVLACDATTEPNIPPESLDPIPDQELFVGDSFRVDLDAHFSDGNNDPLTYTATSLFDIVAVSVSGTTLIGRSLRRGEEEIVVTASDPSGAMALQHVVARVGNRKPEPVGLMPVPEVLPEKEFKLDLAEYFTDPDGDSLRYHARPEIGSRIDVKVHGTMLVGTAGRTEGTKTVFVTAADDGGLRVSRSFSVVVPNVAPEVLKAIPDRQLYPDQSVRIRLEQHFQDLNDDPVVYEVTASGDNVSSRIRGNTAIGYTLTVQAQRERGTSEVAVTALDPKRAMTTLRFSVTVANRPVTGRDGPPLFVRPHSRVIVAPREHFVDPDRDALTYSGVSQNENIVRVTAGGSALTLEIEGSAGLTVPVEVTATDGFGDTAQAIVTVVLYEPTATVFREDFDSAGSLNGWISRYLRGRIVDDKLELDQVREAEGGQEYAHVPAHMYRDLESAGNWEVRFSMGWKAGPETLGVLLVFTPDDAWPIWELGIEYFFGQWIVLISRGNTPWWPRVAHGERPGFVRDQRQREFTWRLIDGVMMVTEGERILYWKEVDRDLPAEAHTPSGITGIGLGTYFTIEDQDGVRVDWVEVSSVKSFGSRAAFRRVPRP